MKKRGKNKFVFAFILAALLLGVPAGCADVNNSTSSVTTQTEVSNGLTTESESLSVSEESTTTQTSVSTTTEMVSEVTAAGDESSVSVSTKKKAKVSLKKIPKYSGTPYIEVNNNDPGFSKKDFTTNSYETYSELDSLGRCHVAKANIGQDLMPKEKRGAIGQVRPSGWHTVKYDNIDDRYLYNRCHLIGYQLTAENANEKNLITGTRYLNVEGMLPFENMVGDYIRETGNHVLYQVTPVYKGDNLVASGVQMQAESVEDKGEGIKFNVYVYNVQPGISIDYSNGESKKKNGGSAEESNGQSADKTVSKTTQNSKNSDNGNSQNETGNVEYVLNTNTKKFHTPSCSCNKTIKDANRRDYNGTRDSLISQGYEPCKRCNP